MNTYDTSIAQIDVSKLLNLVSFFSDSSCNYYKDKMELIKEVKKYQYYYLK